MDKKNNKKITKDEFFAHEKVPRRAKALMHAMYAAETDVINKKFEDLEIKKFELAKSIYYGYQSTKSKSKAALNYYCWILSTKFDIKPPRYYKNWYLIYRHFAIRSKIYTEDLIGIEYKVLKYIAECGDRIMDPYTTRCAIAEVKELHTNHKKKWKYLKDLRDMRKDYLNIKDTGLFFHKWKNSGLI